MAPPLTFSFSMSISSSREHCKRLGGKRLIKFDQVHIRNAQTSTLQNLPCGEDGTKTHIRRIDTSDCRGNNTGTRTQAEPLRLTSCHQHKSRRSIVNASRVASRDTATFFTKNWLKGGKLFKRGIGTRMLVQSNDCSLIALLVRKRYRDDFYRETTRLLCRNRFLLTA